MYSTIELPEFLSAISGEPDPGRALSRGILGIAETFAAEIVAVVSDEEVVASVGYRRGHVPTDELLGALADSTRSVEVPGVGPVRPTILRLREPADGVLIVRADEPLDSVEVSHAQAMTRILELAVSLLDKIDENDRLLEEHRAHERVLEAILRIQRLISRRQPLDVILQAITTEAAFLLGADLAGIRLSVPDGLSHNSVASPTSAGQSLAESIPDKQLTAIGVWAMSKAVDDKQTLSVETRTGREVDVTAYGCPVFDNGAPIGGLFVMARGGGDNSWSVDSATIQTFASQASIALTDANTVSDLENAFHDHLTGLANRELFHDRFSHAMDLAARKGTTTALLFLDLDRFKAVNDQFGHAAGDTLLREVGAELRAMSRAYDSVARIGGDEFAVLLEDTTEEAAELVAKRLFERITATVNPSGLPGRPGVSIGVALSGADSQSTDELLRRADIAMYSVKAAGREGVATYTDQMGRTKFDDQAMTNALQFALDRDEFLVHYQPIISLQNRQLSGVEALVRWRDPARGMIPPADFIAHAEETGLIVPLGRRVLAVACEQAAQWRRSTPLAGNLTLSVNVSPRQLEDDSLLTDVADILAQTGLTPSALTLEVTESIFVGNPDSAGRRLTELKDLGINLAIDDFGTGFSSLSYIHNYPFDVLKIDRSFVKGLGTTDNSGAVVRTMLALASQLSIQAVAEGIETPGELAQLRALRCTHGQGFLFSRPVAADELDALLPDAFRFGAIARA